MLTHMQNKTSSPAELWMDFVAKKNPLHMHLGGFWPKKEELSIFKFLYL